MHATEFQLSTGDHVAFVRAWLPAGMPRAALQIVHGMAEHGGRYARLAQALVAEGYAVYAQDLPGHGRSARAPDELGHFADNEGWELAQLTLFALQREIAARHPQLPQLMLGHSLGSFLLQDYLVHHGGEIQGAILSASSGTLGALRPIGAALLRAEAAWRGPRHRSALAEALTFKTFNRAFRPNRTAFDWLSRDAAEVDRYIADPHCGFRCSATLWASLLGFGAQLRKPARLSKIPASLPLLLIAGSEDPVSQGERGPQLLAQAYRKAGVRDVQVIGYAGARHELFNETCREQVTADVIGWLGKL